MFSQSLFWTSLSACSLVPFTNICSQRRLTVQTFQHLQHPVDKMWSSALKGALLAEEMLKRTIYGVFLGGGRTIQCQRLSSYRKICIPANPLDFLQTLPWLNYPPSNTWFSPVVKILHISPHLWQTFLPFVRVLLPYLCICEMKWVRHPK